MDSDIFMDCDNRDIFNNKKSLYLEQSILNEKS